MGAIHALVLALNLLLAIAVYVSCADRTGRIRLLHGSLAASFLILALADVSLIVDGPPATDRVTAILIVDALLIVFAATVIHRERERRRADRGT